MEAIEKRKDLAASAVRLLKRREAAARLADLLKTKNLDVRRPAAHALAELGVKASASLPALLDALGDSDPEVEGGLREAVGKIVLADGLEATLRLAKDRRPSVREVGVRFLGYKGTNSEVVVPVMLKAIRDEDRDVRRAAVSTIRQYGKHPAVVAALIEALKDKDPRKHHGDSNVFDYAAFSLSSIGRDAEKALPTLLELAENGDPHSRRQVVICLGRFGRLAPEFWPRIFPVLLAILKDKKAGRLRGAAAGMMEEMGRDAKGAVPVLIDILREKMSDEDEAPWVFINDDPGSVVKTMLMPPWASSLRSGILSALAAVGPESRAAIPTIVEILGNNSRTLSERRNAAEALGKIDPSSESARKALEKAARDVDDDLRASAEQALKRFPAKGS